MTNEIIALRIKYKDKYVDVLSPTSAFSLKKKSAFTVLVSATCEDDKTEIGKIANYLLEIGCVEFCCSGLNAEALHDSLDEIIEATEHHEVVTTFFEDDQEACEYFLNVSGGLNLGLVALIANQPILMSKLLSEAEIK
jgi:hypothetical protein